MAKDPGGQGWREAGGIQGFLQGLKVPTTSTTQPGDNVVQMDRAPLAQIEKHIRELMNSRVNCEAQLARLQDDYEAQMTQVQQSHNEVCTHLRRWQAQMSERMKELGIKCEIVEPSRGDAP